MFLNIHIDLIILKTHNQQITLTSKKSLHIIFKAIILLLLLLCSSVCMFSVWALCLN